MNNKTNSNIKTFVNNNWFVSSIFFSAGIIFVTPDSINLNYIDYVYKLFISIRTALIFGLLTALIVVIIFRVLNNKIFHFGDENFFYQFPFFIKFLSLFKKRNEGKSKIELTLNEFSNNSKSYYKLDNSSPWCTSNQNNTHKKSHVIYKIPARNHISIPDLIDLRLLKKLICNRVNVSVIIIDIPYTLNNSDFRHSWSEITKQRVLSILGKGTRVIYLTELLSINPHDSFKLVCTDVIPFFAKGSRFDSSPLTPDDIKQIENISHAGKPLLLIGLDNLIDDKDNVYAIQYYKRVKSWDLYYPIFTDRLKVFTNQSHFITVNSLLDPNGNVFKPFVKDYGDFNNFNLTDDYFSICKKVFSRTNNSWSIPTEYILNICMIVFGRTIIANTVKSKKLIRILENNQEIDQSFIKDNLLTDKDVICRYFLLKEIKRLQRTRNFQMK